MLSSNPRLPFVGIKESGCGRELSYYRIKEFMNINIVTSPDPAMLVRA
jgi:succinate-semialdehyde dehydrogenase/glutarate-semialdehyde dehydrogenase